MVRRVPSTVSLLPQRRPDGHGVRLSPAAWAAGSIAALRLAFLVWVVVVGSKKVSPDEPRVTNP